MNLKILSAAFLMGVSATSLLAQLPTPPVCTNVQDTFCADAVAVYEAIIATKPTVATAALEESVGNLRNLVTHPQNVENTAGTSMCQAYQLVVSSNGTCVASPSIAGCSSLNSAWIQILDFISQNPLLPSEHEMRNLVASKGNMSQLNSYSSQFYKLFYYLNQLDTALTSFSSTAAPASSASKTLQRRAPVSASPTKAAPAKK